jgi:hypothetical protein
MGKKIKTALSTALVVTVLCAGTSQPGNCRDSQELSAFAADVAAPPNHAGAHAPACI